MDGNPIERLPPIQRREAISTQTGIDLQVDFWLLTKSPLNSRRPLKLLHGRNSDLDIGLYAGLHRLLRFDKPAEHLGLYAGSPKLKCLVGICNSERMHSCSIQRTGNLEHAVAVGVCLNHCHYPSRGSVLNQHLVVRNYSI